MVNAPISSLDRRLGCKPHLKRVPVNGRNRKGRKLLSKIMPSHLRCFSGKLVRKWRSVGQGPAPPVVVRAPGLRR
jgi:hypothetical protein